ncbi:MAG: hydroxymethylbilane synthase [Firmicutes bacterium]|nr:hydroxymethylbilane synthase [Bacillota bacterium]
MTDSRRLKTSRTFRVGTRGSQLALTQGGWALDQLKRAWPGVAFELKVITTHGDRVHDIPLPQIGERGLFVKEIEAALARHDIDLAIHSLKDVPTELAPGMELVAITSRADPRDALVAGGASGAVDDGPRVSGSGGGLTNDRPGDRPAGNPPAGGLADNQLGGGSADSRSAGARPSDNPPGVGPVDSPWGDGAALPSLAKGARLGTGSLRRIAQLKYHRPDLQFVPVRGNLDTRLRKLAREQLDGLVLACAGLDRLGRSEVVSERISPEICLPAAGQGALAIEARADDFEARKMALGIQDTAARLEALAERSFLGALGGGCHVPIGVLARLEGNLLRLAGTVAEPSGQKLVRAELSEELDCWSGMVNKEGMGSSEGMVRGVEISLEGEHTSQQAVNLGQRLARMLLEQGAGEILAAFPPIEPWLS